MCLPSWCFVLSFFTMSSSTISRSLINCSFNHTLFTYFNTLHGGAPKQAKEQTVRVSSSCLCLPSCFCPEILCSSPISPNEQPPSKPAKKSGADDPKVSFFVRVSSSCCVCRVVFVLKYFAHPQNVNTPGKEADGKKETERSYFPSLGMQDCRPLDRRQNRRWCSV